MMRLVEPILRQESERERERESARAREQESERARKKDLEDDEHSRADIIKGHVAIDWVAILHQTRYVEGQKI